MGSIIWLFIVMTLIATVAFAPLAYFIYMYTKKTGEPFGETEPHGDKASAVNDLAEKAIAFVKGKLAKK